jgi:hypothetical protein
MFCVGGVGRHAPINPVATLDEGIGIENARTHGTLCEFFHGTMTFLQIK